MISPKEVHFAAIRLEKENLRFRTFLKNRVQPDDLDEKFHALHKELFTHYDCRQCGNCCRVYTTMLDDDEVDAIASHLHLSISDFKSKYLTEGSEGYVLKAPCPFFGYDGACAIQECKPAECRGFPYTDRPDRWSSLYSILEFAEHCPVVFEMLEQLKDIYRFRR